LSPAGSGRIFDTIYYKLEEVEKWLLNCARNANKPIPVASATTTKKVNVPKRLTSVLLNHVTSHQKTRKIEVRYDPEQLSGVFRPFTFVESVLALWSSHALMSTNGVVPGWSADRKQSTSAVTTTVNSLLSNAPPFLPFFCIGPKVMLHPIHPDRK
jgi:hypothetical protein